MLIVYYIINSTNSRAFESHSNELHFDEHIMSYEENRGKDKQRNIPSLRICICRYHLYMRVH